MRKDRQYYKALPKAGLLSFPAPSLKLNHRGFSACATNNRTIRGGFNMPKGIKTVTHGGLSEVSEAVQANFSMLRSGMASDTQEARLVLGHTSQPDLITG